MENTTLEAKERILQASTKLFSKKGFDATSVNEIARSAEVTKPLIYYYFESKNEILDSVVASLFSKLKSLKMDFIHTNIVQMIEDQHLEIKHDRLIFTDDKYIADFLDNGYEYFEEVFDFALENRSIIRILMFESLKDNKEQNDLFRFMSPSMESKENPLVNSISQLDDDFHYSADKVMFRFFYTIFPLINFVAFYDDYKAISEQSDEELRSSFLGTFKVVTSFMISGNEIMLGD